MSEEFQTGILLFTVGMVTVFLVLIIVVLTGKALIALVGRFSSEHVRTPSPTAAMPVRHGAIRPKTMAVITAAVLHVTHGEGTPDKVQKLK